MLLIKVSRQVPSEELREFLVKTTINERGELAREAAESLYIMYSDELIADSLFSHEESFVRELSHRALGRRAESTQIIKLIDALADPARREFAEEALIMILKDNSKMIKPFLNWLYEHENEQIKDGLANVLLIKLEYFLSRIVSDDTDKIKELIRRIIKAGNTSTLIGFINRNKNAAVEKEILRIIKDCYPENKDFEKELKLYLDPGLLLKINLLPEKIYTEPRILNREKEKVRILYGLLFALLLFFPAVFTLRHHQLFGETEFADIVSLYLYDFNYYLAFYFLAANILILFFQLFSMLEVVRQSRRWKAKSLSALYKDRMLPSISVLAPAYNEGENIIESVNSLLNLRYPDYELIVINDGSKDKTLQKLIDFFEMEKVDIKISQRLNTKPIRGIYLSRSNPGLTVVDKVNGGKADALNTGINVSQKEFICGIDSDSLLERDSLLKIASEILNSDKESVALGGNILPVNGCRVDKGYLEEIRLSKNHLARFQSIEYIRSFLAGRTGWSFINSLMIISGAFGLFKKKRIIDLGGYLTEAERFQKDTVGEDMEIVVRLTRSMRSKKKKYKIHYVFNANCWTEVPESFRILYRQRDRWQRGLLDILTYHRRILFNPGFGTAGLVAFPYYFVFEAVGPLIEMKGYIILIASAILGILGLDVVLLLIISSILLGMFCSVNALIIGRGVLRSYSNRELLIMLGYALLENFGFRQLVSMWRATGYFTSLKRPKGWGRMVRKGIGRS